MSNQQLIDTLRNRGYRFNLNQFSADQLLQLLRESDVLYHQLKKDGNESQGESSTTAKVMHEKRKNSEQHTQIPGSGALETQVQPENNISSPRDSSEVELGSAGREGEGTVQDGPGGQAVAENPLPTRFSPEDWREGATRAKAGKGKSEPANGEQSESDVQRKGKKKMTEKAIGEFISPPFRSASD